MHPKGHCRVNVEFKTKFPVLICKGTWLTIKYQLWMRLRWSLSTFFSHLAPVVQRVDNFIQRINILVGVHFICWIAIYPLDLGPDPTFGFEAVICTNQDEVRRQVLPSDH